MKILTKWNTNSKTAALSNLLMHKLLTRLEPESLLSLEGTNQVAEAFLAYGARHLSRVESLYERTFHLDLLLQISSQTLPPVAGEDSQVSCWVHGTPYI